MKVQFLRVPSSKVQVHLIPKMLYHIPYIKIWKSEQQQKKCCQIQTLTLHLIDLRTHKLINIFTAAISTFVCYNKWAEDA